MAIPELTTQVALNQQLQLFPQIRFMGSKARLLPWISEKLRELSFDSAIDAFSGSGAVSYLLKAMGKRVISNDRLAFSATIAEALIDNADVRLTESDLELLVRPNRSSRHFIERTFSGIFFQPSDLRFLDLVSGNLIGLSHPHKRAIAISALVRSCVKRQPRGVFTVAGDPDHYKDGRRDLRLSIREHFFEHVDAYNRAVFDNGLPNRSHQGDVFSVDPIGVDLVYLDPPYVPRSDDNCYVKRYHFLEGLATYWEGLEILEGSRVKKLRKPFTPFSYRRTAIEAFDQLFDRFRDSILVLSYSSNGYPDLSILTELMGRYKRNVETFERSHRYHFGTHGGAKRNAVTEFLIVGY